MSFYKNKEDFICDNCGVKVVGNGYTNHCPVCLWSKHLDKDPGDRTASCGSLMRPISYEKVGERIIITHKCLGCTHIRKNKMAENDNFDQLTSIN